MRCRVKTQLKITVLYQCVSLYSCLSTTFFFSTSGVGYPMCSDFKDPSTSVFSVFQPLFFLWCVGRLLLIQVSYLATFLPRVLSKCLFSPIHFLTSTHSLHDRFLSDASTLILLRQFISEPTIRFSFFMLTMLTCVEYCGIISLSILDCPQKSYRLDINCIFKNCIHYIYPVIKSVSLTLSIQSGISYTFTSMLRRRSSATWMQNGQKCSLCADDRTATTLTEVIPLCHTIRMDR